MGTGSAAVAAAAAEACVEAIAQALASTRSMAKELPEQMGQDGGVHADTRRTLCFRAGLDSLAIFFFFLKLCSIQYFWVDRLVSWLSLVIAESSQAVSSCVNWLSA